MIPVSPPDGSGNEPPRRRKKWSRKSRSAAARPSPISKPSPKRSRQQDRQDGGSTPTASSTAVVNNAGIRCGRDLPQDEHRRLRVRDQGAPDGFVLCRARGSAGLFREQESGRSFTSPRLRPGRQFRPGQLRAAKLGIVGLSKSIAPRHEPLQCALELRLAVRLEPADRNHSDRDEAEKARVAKIQQMDRKDRAGLRLLLTTPPRMSPGDFCGADERDFPD